MANMCINRFYCSTDNEANYEKILYGLGDRFDLYDLDGRDNWMRGEFDSKWCYPEEGDRSDDEDVGEGPDASYRDRLL